MTNTVTTRHDTILPTVVAHADWGKDRRKRQVATVRLERPGPIGPLEAGRDAELPEVCRDGEPPKACHDDEPPKACHGAEPPKACHGAEPRYVVDSLAAAPEAKDAVGGRGLLHDLRAAALPGQLLIGFDFPIGLPLAYARAVGIASFPEFLGAMGSPPWEEFDLVARNRSDITLHRPFYPHAPGGARREHLQLGLELTAKELRRRCEGTDAEVLFWTLGSKQVGKGALAGWRLLAAAQRDPGLALWPFAGSLPELLDGGSRIVAAETYPREYYKYAMAHGTAHSAGVARKRWSKRRRADRLALVPGILAWAESLGVGWEPRVRDRVEQGFSDGANGEDEFDAVIGLLAMISVVTGTLSPGEPCDEPAVATVEGWILGRSASSLPKV